VALTGALLDCHKLLYFDLLLDGDCSNVGWELVPGAWEISVNGVEPLVFSLEHFAQCHWTQKDRHATPADNTNH
jgi:hypothetical protein